MAERRKNKKKKEADIKDVDDKPSKEEYAVARYLKQKLPEKKTTLLGHKVEYFIACKAVDCLADSSWAKENKKGEFNFSNRSIAIDFMAKLLDHKFFHRAKKIVVEPKKKKKEIEESAPDSGKETKKSKATKSEVASEKTEEKDAKKEGSDPVEKKKEKKKIKLDMHLEQLFIDSNEPYVWIYDPIPLRTWITGTLMVIAAVLLCLFPLWPQTIRHYIYYLSVAVAFFLVFIIGLAVLRLIVFVILWVVTMGKHHLWLLPNLTEDVGFFESFWPLYKYQYKGDKKDGKHKSHKETDTKEKTPPDDTKEVEKPPHEEDQEKDQSQSQSESGGEDRSDADTPKTEENGFEFVEADELSADEEDPKTK